MYAAIESLPEDFKKLFELPNPFPNLIFCEFKNFNLIAPDNFLPFVEKYEKNEFVKYYETRQYLILDHEITKKTFENLVKKFIPAAKIYQNKIIYTGTEEVVRCLAKFMYSNFCEILIRENNFIYILY